MWVKCTLGAKTIAKLYKLYAEIAAGTLKNLAPRYPTQIR